ncbi:MAG: helix-turn-helix domain-containing protein [Clostridia bacterium]|nr:helix-turn-helix domain-containing protein [Clostridia bacterium]MBR4443830.1 helix-turn-helix domain-containing protein [Clostridia bacterium]
MSKQETIGERIRRRRLELGVSVDDLARALGKNRTTIYRYENSRIGTLPSAVLEPLAEALETTPEALMGWPGRAGSALPGGVIPVRSLRPIPIIGSVRAGWDGLALEEILGVDYADVGTPSEYFFLQVHGDSMSPGINDGDLALVHRQPTAENGDIVVAVVNGSEGTIKKYLRHGATVVLHPFNEKYSDLVLSGEALDGFSITGKVVETKRKW